MPVFEQLVPPAILQCQRQSGTPPSVHRQLGGPQSSRVEVLCTGKHVVSAKPVSARSMHISDLRLHWTTEHYSSRAVKRTTGKEMKELLIKASPETGTKPLEAIFGRLITKWVFPKRQVVTLSSLKWHLLMSSLSYVLSWCQ